MSTIAPAVNRDDPAWHEWRRQGIGGSDVAAICGLSKWDSAFSLYMTKRGEVDEPDLSDNPTVTFGARLEPIIPPWFHEETGLHLIGEQTWAEHPDHPHHRCTLDAYVVESPTSSIDDALGVAEIKVTGDTPDEWEQQIPNAYAVQGQWQMHVTGHRHLWFPIVHVHRRVLRVYEMERDDGVIAELVRLVDQFWQQVQDGTPPPVDGHEATTRAIREAYPQHIDDETEIGTDLFERWRIAKGRVAAAKAECDAVENELKAALGTAAVATANGVPVVSYKTQRTTRLDHAAIRAEVPEMYERYGTESTSRVLRALKIKEKK